MNYDKNHFRTSGLARKQFNNHLQLLYSTSLQLTKSKLKNNN